MSRAPRIDTVRNQITATRTLLGTVLEELEDLHVLAYDRQAASADVAVRGGERDFALDTHGDPRARDAYRRLSATIGEVCGLIAVRADDVIKLLREGDAPDQSKGRSGRITREELAEQIQNQSVRITRGEYEPVRIRPQPEAKAARKVLDRVRRERDEARRIAERQTREVQRLTERLALVTPPEREKTW